MREEQRQEFAEVMRATLEVYGSSLTRGAVETWWRLLEPYGIEDVRRALQEHLSESVYPPKPADVLGRLQRLDGHPDSDEAWRYALAAMSEEATVLWTPEIAQAKSAADPIYAEGDRIGARMAFKTAYERAVREARQHGRRAQWRISPGHDPEERQQKVQEAVAAGLISENHARQFLAPPAEPAPAIAHQLRGTLESPSESGE